MKLTDDVRLSPDVVSREVGAETMLLDLASGTYFGLDPVGARFLLLVEQGKSTLQARDSLLEMYDVEPAVLNKDLKALLNTLSLNGIIKTEP